MKDIKYILVDKTGTLTTGKFEVKKVVSLKEDKTQDDILYLASLGEQNSLHPLARSIVEANHKKLQQVDDVKEVAGEGVYFEYKKEKYFVGRRSKGLDGTVVEVFCEDEKLGEIYLADKVKESAAVACKELKAMGIKTIILSGDNLKSVKQVAEIVGVDEYKNNLLPQEKYEWIENHKDKNQKIGYVGDGINDSPALVLADVGISMGINGSPATIEASDIVLADDNPQKVATAVKISKYTQKIVWQNIIFSAGIKLLFLSLGSFGVTGMLSAVFADVGVTVLAILNSLRALKYLPHVKKLEK